MGKDRWEKERLRVMATSALGKITTPDDVADVVLSLASRADMVTAQNIIIGADNLGI